MPTRFEQFRVSLLKRPQRDIENEFPDPDPQDYLRRVFGERVTFSHLGNEFAYLPYTGEEIPPLVIGGIGRPREAVETPPTPVGFSEEVHLAWQSALLVFDPVNHADGQKLAMAVEQPVGKPHAVLPSFVKAINDANPRSAYLIEVEPLFDAGNFWAFAERYRGNVVSVTFDFIVPNGIWSSQSSIRDELITPKENVGAQHVVTTLKSSEGLKLDDPSIHEAVNYAESGSGSIRAEARVGRSRRYFNSKNKTKSSVVDDDPASPSLLGRLRAVADRILDRD